jgi:hypothetical protein
MDRTQVALGPIAAIGVAAGVSGPDIAVGAATTPQFESLSPGEAQDLCTQLTGRPVCAWPKVAKYNGSGPVDSAASYSCRASKTP